MENKTVIAQRSTPYLFLAFVGLLIAKLGFGIQIGWLWVTAPLWIPFVFVAAVFLLFGIGVVITLLGAVIFDRLNRNARARRFAR